MDTNEVIYMYFNMNVCRLCTRERNALRPLFDGNEDLPAKIKVLSPCIQMFAGDGLPSHVCEDCIGQVNSFCDFKSMVEASDCSLRDFLRRQQERRCDQVMFVKEEVASSDDICRTVVTEVPTEDVFEEVEDPLLIKQEHDPVMVVDVAIQNVDNTSSNNSNHNLHHHHHPAERGDMSIDHHHPAERGDMSIDQKPVSSTLLPNSDHRLYECSACAKKFSTSHGLKIHIRSHADLRGYECMICSKKFSTWQQFRGHRHTHTEGLNLECRLCNKIFNTVKGLKVHCSRYHAVGRPFECSVCKKTYDTEHSLKIHGKLHSGERRHTCLVCNETFSTGLGLRVHSRTHTDRTSEVSPVSDGYSLIQQNNFTVLDLPCECVYCKKRFIAMKGLRGHQRFCKSKPPNEVPSTSTTSGQELPNETATNQGCHECPFCKRTFTEWSSLNYHVRFHKRRSWKCGICVKSFKSRKGLKCHERLHSKVTDGISAVNEVLHNDSQSVIRVTSDDSSRNDSTLSADSLETRSQCTACNLFFRNARGLRTHKGRIHKQETQQTAVINNPDTPDTAEVIEDDLMQGSVELDNVRCLRSHQWRFCKDSDTLLPSLNSGQKQVSEVTGITVQGDGKDGQVQGHNCVDCSKSFHSEKGLLIHNSKLHRLNCSESSAGNTSVVTIDVCDGEAETQCHICDKTFNSNRAFLIHCTKIHKASSIEEVISPQDSDDDPSGYYKCKICNEKYKSVKSFRLHCTRLQHMVQENVAQQVEDNNVDTYECPICERSFFSEQGYNRHNLKAHKGSVAVGVISPQEAGVDGPSGYFECKVCNAKYKKVKSFRLHCTRLQHMVQENISQQADDNNIGTFNCALCNKNYFSEHGYNCHNLKAHQGTIAEEVVSPQEADVDGLPGYYECKVCNAKYRKVKSFRLHCTRLQHMVQDNVTQQAEDSNVNTYDCSLCNRNFFSEHSYNRHSLNAHKGSIPEGVISSQGADNNGPLGYYECKVCNDKYRNVKSFRLHCTRLQHMVQENVAQQSEDSNVGTYKCLVCNRNFFSEHSYNCHRLRNHKNLSFVTADITGVSSSTPQNIENNLQRDGESGNCLKESLCCTLCQRHFNSAAGLKIHHTVQHSDASAVQKQMYGENLQMRNSLLSSSFKCCNELFISESGLKIHQRKYHKDYCLNEGSVREIPMVCIEDGTETVNYVCSFCDRTFVSENDLRIHHANSHSDRHTEDIVKNEIPLIQQSTELNFTTSTQNQLYECSSCGRSFHSEKGRRLHCRRMHEDINRFCTINCDDQSVSLVASTANSGLFPCSLCSSIFSNERNLKIHNTQNHSGQLYDRSAEAVSHVISSEAPSGTLCSVCNRTFCSEEALTLHFTKNHADSLISTVAVPSFTNWQNVVC